MRYFSLLFFLFMAGCASRPPIQTVDASVVESNYYTNCQKTSVSTGERIVGAGAGYLVGKQFGKGSGNRAMRLVGVGAGFALANALGGGEECKSGFYSVIKFHHPKTGLIAFDEIPTQGKKLPKNYPVKFSKRF